MTDTPDATATEQAHARRSDRDAATEKVAARNLRVRLWRQLPLLVVLVVLWMLLWGQLSWLALVTGIVLAFLVTRVFYLPPVDLSGRFNPFWFAVFLSVFLWQLVIASFQVAVQAFYPRPVEKNSVLGVQLSTRSDVIMTLTAISLSLIPGSLVLEVDRQRSILYLHVLNTRDTAAAERFRRDIQRLEWRIVRSIGSKDDLRRMS
jgi:multicomponent Na+:H+ antiporter subunit E